MGLLSDKPLWYIDNTTGDWVKYDNASDYSEFDDTITGDYNNQEFLDNFMTFAVSDDDAYNHDGEVVHDKTIWISMGATSVFSDGLSAHYDYKTLPNVVDAFGLGNNDALEGEHYDVYLALEDSAINLMGQYTFFLSNTLQDFVDNIRELDLLID